MFINIYEMSTQSTKRHNSILPGKEQMPRDWEHSTTDRDNLQNTHTHTTNHSQSVNISPAVGCAYVCFSYHEIWKGVASTSPKSSSSDESNSLVLIAPVYQRHKCNHSRHWHMRAEFGTAIQTALFLWLCLSCGSGSEKFRWFQCTCMKKKCIICYETLLTGLYIFSFA